MNFNKPVSIDFDLISGLSSKCESTKRYLSQMKNMYLNEKCRDSMEDVLVYEFYELDIPKTNGDLAFGTSIVYPGKVDNEYFMTNGHFHEIIDTAEVYYGLSGNGYLLMENMDGDSCALELKKGQAVYVPKGYAHRMINTSNEPLVIFYTYPANAGHDYQTIKTQGFLKLCIDENGPKFIDNPRKVEKYGK